MKLSKLKLKSRLKGFIIILIAIEVTGILFSFIFYKDNDESLYYNKTRLLCADKLNEVKQALMKEHPKEQYNFKPWKYSYAVIDNTGTVRYNYNLPNLGNEVDLQEFLQFDRSSSIQYKGYIKSSFPIIIDKENRGFFVAFISSKDLQEKSLFERKLETLMPLLAALLLTTLILVICNFYVGKNIIEPITKITKSSNDIIKGKFDNYITFNSNTEIGELSYAFELMRDELYIHGEREEKLKNSQKEIIAAISHDLKTPLASISIYVEAIKDGMAENREDRLEYTSIILKKVDILNKLIDDLLEHSKADLEVLSIDKKEVHIKPFLENIIEEIQLELCNSNAKFYWDKDIPEGIINIDELRISQVVFNLVSNSMKYASEDLVIKFRSEIKDRYLYIYIEDNGKGIAAEDIPFIFNKFYRGDKSRNNKIPGSGLGLSTSKYIVEKHQGEIYCRSLADKGSIFYFSIPLA